VTSRAEVFLGVIAVATLATAVVQIGVLIGAALLARRVSRLIDRVELEMRPLFDRLNEIGRDASRASAMAVAQVERVDTLFADLTGRLEQGLADVQATVTKPLREGSAILAGFRAAINALKDARSGRARARSEDEDALFV
jgi:hypothetical protein